MFQVGDQVTWCSQAGGFTATKTGSVVEVVPVGEHPKTPIKGMGMMARRNESYVVRVYSVQRGPDHKGAPAGQKDNRLYWPREQLLRPAYDIFNEDALRREIIRVWGPAGAHIEVYDAVLLRAGLSSGRT